MPLIRHYQMENLLHDLLEEKKNHTQKVIIFERALDAGRFCIFP